MCSKPSFIVETRGFIGNRWWCFSPCDTLSRVVWEKPVNKKWSALGLALRLLFAWWVVPSLLFLLLGWSLGGCLAFTLFPLLALGVSAFATRIQYLSFKEHPFALHLGASQRTTIQVPIPRTDVEGEVASLLQGPLASTSLAVVGHRLHAVFQPPPWSTRWQRWIHSDEVTVDIVSAAEGEAGGSTLDIWSRPISRLIYGWFWIDRGRNQRRLQQFQEHFSLRLAAAARQKEADHQATSLEARLAQAELLLLRAQVEPHFLFNALAHLRELVRTGDTPASVAMLDHLIAYARSTSDRIRQATHRLRQELESARGYLSLIQIRFGDRLGFEIDVDPALEDCEVPVGCLLIPLENAIKHGIEPRPAPGFVSLRGRREGGNLLLEVQDDGLGLLQGPETGRGTGLANLRERLNLLYADAGRLRVEGLEVGGVRVQVTMPVGRRSPT